MFCDSIPGSASPRDASLHVAIAPSHVSSNLPPPPPWMHNKSDTVVKASLGLLSAAASRLSRAFPLSRRSSKARGLSYAWSDRSERSGSMYADTEDSGGTTSPSIAASSSTDAHVAEATYSETALACQAPASPWRRVSHSSGSAPHLALCFRSLLMQLAGRSLLGLGENRPYAA